MSRTYKDTRKRTFRAYWKNDDTESIEYESENPRYTTSTYKWTYTIQLPTTKPKLRKEVDTEDHWMSTPSWWNNLFHNRPIRRKFSNYCTNAVGYKVEALEEMLEPSDSRKPHKYYW